MRSWLTDEVMVGCCWLNGDERVESLTPSLPVAASAAPPCGKKKALQKEVATCNMDLKQTASFSSRSFSQQCQQPTYYIQNLRENSSFNCLQCTYVQHRTWETNCSKQELLAASQKIQARWERNTGAHQSFVILLACPAAAVDGADKDLKLPMKTFATSTSLRQQTMSILGMKQASKHPTSLLHQSFHCRRRSMEVQRQSMWPTRLRQTNHEHSEHETNKQTIPHQFTRASLL